MQSTRFVSGRLLTFGWVAVLALTPGVYGQKTATSISHADSSFLKEAAEGGMNEVKLGEIAKEKATNQRVKKFAQRMVDDHSKVNDEVRTLAAEKGVTLPSDIGLTHKASNKVLSVKTGDSFDKAYMADMVKDHKDDIAAFEKQAASGGDPDVKSFASKSLPTLREHLKMAEDIAREVGATMH